jgi:hypothetical protein
MRWAAIALGGFVALAVLSWALVTTGHWPLDDRKPPARAIYAINEAVGQWLVDHAEPGAALGIDLRAGGRPPPGPPPGLSPSELAAAQEALRTEPKFSGRHRFTQAPAAIGASGGSSGRG